jgi:GNAT superfamily N-acetyltransferase
MRGSQMLVLPPFQRHGLGAVLLQQAYVFCRGLPTAIDITVEDPSDQFMPLRDYVDCKAVLEAFPDPAFAQGPFSQEKITAIQVRGLFFCAFVSSFFFLLIFSAVAASAIQAAGAART